MKKTYKEKYLELKKENDYLFQFNCIKNTDLIVEKERYKSLKNEFDNFKLELKKKEALENKRFFIFSIIGLSLLTIFAIISLFVG